MFPLLFYPSHFSSFLSEDKYSREWTAHSAVVLDIVLAEVACAVLFAHVSTANNALQGEAGMAVGFSRTCALRGGLTYTGAAGSAL